jgi:hypothetical protein
MRHLDIEHAHCKQPKDEIKGDPEVFGFSMRVTHSRHEPKATPEERLTLRVRDDIFGGELSVKFSDLSRTTYHNYQTTYMIRFPLAGGSDCTLLQTLC